MEHLSNCPTLEELGQGICNPLFEKFCTEMREKYNVKEKIEFSKCNWEYGWNIKFKKSGKNLCTVYMREGYFTVMVVVSAKEKELVELLLPEMTTELQEIYHKTREGNGQRWLMIDLRDDDDVYRDVLRLIEIRKEAR